MEKTHHLHGLNHEYHDESCGCEHHREHHHHGESCGCGHHHEHHHHGESYGCGHHHEHHHHEGCGCENHHEHHHHGESCGCGHHHGNQVMIGKMSGHLLGTMTVYVSTPLPVTEVNMNLSMKDAVYFVKESGGVPMQVKASLKDHATTVIMNMLGKDIYRTEAAESTETDETKVKCNLLVVADGIEPEALRNKLEELMDYFIHNSF